ncbi:MAG: M23 family metallopeptidase [Gaiellaceae bacterium]
MRCFAGTRWAAQRSFVLSRPRATSTWPPCVLDSHSPRGPVRRAIIPKRTLTCALAALLVLLVPVSQANAVPDVPLDIYLDHLEPLSLAWPADGTMTDGYGPRWGRMHLGIDVGILRSLDVRAATSGTVMAAGWLTGYDGYGNVVMLDIGSGYTLLYAHLSVAHVVPGQWLAAGETVGEAGCTGSCTGTHLHFELREHGVPIDPAPYFG